MGERPMGGKASVFAFLIAFSPTLLAVTRGVNALVSGAVILFVLVVSTALVSPLGPLLGGRAKLLVHLVVAALLVTAADVGLEAWMPAVRADLGISLLLATPGCVLLGRAVAAPSPRETGRSLAEALRLGAGVWLGLFAIGCLREMLAFGTVTLLPLGRFRGVLTLPGLARQGAAVAAQSAGALFLLGFLTGCAKWVAMRRRKT